jgi:hypothetical protein
VPLRLLQSVLLSYTRIASDVRVGAVVWRFSRARLPLLAVGLALSASGCWMYALQYAPQVLATGLQLTSAAVGASQPANDYSPGVIELRDDPAGAPEYRELKIDFTPNEARWTPVVDYDTAADGWRPAVNFLQMNFTPPLPAVFSESQITYLAYAPATIKTPDDEVQLRTFDQSFGDPVGTFNWNGHLYQYSLPKILPPLQYD